MSDLLSVLKGAFVVLSTTLSLGFQAVFGIDTAQKQNPLPTPPTLTAPSTVASSSQKDISLLASSTPGAKKIIVGMVSTSSAPRKTLSKSPVVEVPTPLPPASSTQPALDTKPDMNTYTKNALVNILCIPAANTPVKAITGTGVVIDPRGIILTNAHIAQYFILQNVVGQKIVTCTIRTGSPAVATDKAVALYVSPLWIEKNSTVLISDDPSGTGEDDFGLLLITTPHAKDFDFVEFDTITTPKERDAVFVAGYAAGFLGNFDIEKNLWALSSFATIDKLYSFGDLTDDFMTISGNVVAQRGSSGGAILNTDKKLIALISTVSSEATTDKRVIGAISLRHINKSLESQQGVTLRDFISGDVVKKVQQFYTVIAPELAQILLDSIAARQNASVSQ